jgi:hypothetical protein
MFVCVLLSFKRLDRQMGAGVTLRLMRDQYGLITSFIKYMLIRAGDLLVFEEEHNWIQCLWKPLGNFSKNK